MKSNDIYENYCNSYLDEAFIIGNTDAYLFKSNHPEISKYVHHRYIIFSDSDLIIRYILYVSVAVRIDGVVESMNIHIDDFTKLPFKFNEELFCHYFQIKEDTFITDINSAKKFLNDYMRIFLNDPDSNPGLSLFKACTEDIQKELSRIAMAAPVYKQKIGAFNYNFDINYHNISNYDISSMLFCKNILEHEGRCIINHVMRNNDECDVYKYNCVFCNDDLKINHFVRLTKMVYKHSVAKIRIDFDYESFADNPLDIGSNFHRISYFLNGLQYYIEKYEQGFDKLLYEATVDVNEIHIIKYFIKYGDLDNYLKTRKNAFHEFVIINKIPLSTIQEEKSNE